MIDAYTIGITLVLEDGVSEGIAAVRKDLAALDAAIAASAMGLEQLRRLASSIANPSLPIGVPPVSARKVRDAQPEPVADTPGGPTAKQTTDDVPITIPRTALPADDGGSGSVSRGSPPVTPAAEPQAAAHPGAPVPPLAPSPVPFARPASSIDASGRAESPRPPAQPTNSSARSDVAALPQAERPMAHSAPAAIPMPARPPTVARDNSPPPPRLSLPPAPGPDPVAMPRAMAVLPSDSHSQPLSSPRIADAPRQPATPQVGQPVAPIPLSRPQAPTSPTAAEAISPVASRPAPEAPTADPPAFAEIHLDGQALGRWLTRQLEARLNRPPAGTTGFDPRMTPTWPGAPTGN